MTDRPSQPDELPQLDVPQALADDLRHLYRPPGAVPEAVDETILAAARSAMIRRRRTRMVLRWVQGAAAAAAAVALVMWVSWPDERSRVAEVTPLASAAPADPRDIDLDGRVDILDAFALARHLEGTDPPANNWDMNGDGVVDQGDVDSVAMAAVSLKGEAL